MFVQFAAPVSRDRSMISIGLLLHPRGSNLNPLLRPLPRSTSRLMIVLAANPISVPDALEGFSAINI